MTQTFTTFAKMSRPARTWLNPILNLFLVQATQQTIQVFNPKIGGVSFLDLPPQKIISFSSPVEQVVFSSDGLKMACGLTTGDINEVDLQNFTISSVSKKHKAKIIALAYSNQNNLASCDKDNKILFFNSKTKKEKFGKTKIRDNVQTILWLDENRVLTGGSNGSLYVWDSSKTKVIHESNAHESAISILLKRKDELHIISGEQKGKVKFWRFDKTKNNPHLIKSIEITEINPHEGDMNQAGTIMLLRSAEGNICLFDISKINDEKKLLFLPIREPSYTVKWGIEPGTFYSVQHNGVVRVGKNFHLLEINDVYLSITEEINQRLYKINNLPEWIHKADIEVININQINSIELKLQVAEKIISTTLHEQFKDPFWVYDNFNETLEVLEGVENRISNSISKLRKKIISIIEEEKRREADRSLLIKEVVNYLQKITPGIRVSVEQLADHFKISINGINSILKEIENTKLVADTLRGEHIGSNWEKDDIISEEGLGHLGSVILCYYCDSKYNSKETSCPSCKRKTKFCTICKKAMGKNQAIIACSECHTDFHFACFESKVKLFARCPKCREIIDIESIKRSLNTQEKENQDLSSSLNRMMSIGKHIHYEEDPDDDLFDF